MIKKEDNKKHAYLIIAHKNDMCFHTLLEMLDDCRNDIFIHMDAKCPGYNPQLIENSVHESRVYHVERCDVKWGGQVLYGQNLI